MILIQCSCMTLTSFIRRPWGSSGKLDTWIYRQWRSVCEEIYGPAAGRSKTFSITRRLYLSESPIRFRNRFLLPFISGYSLENYMIHSRSFLLPWIWPWRTSNMFIPLLWLGGSVHRLVMVDSADSAVKLMICQLYEKADSGFGKQNINSRRICFLCSLAKLSDERYGFFTYSCVLKSHNSVDILYGQEFKFYSIQLPRQ